MKKIVYISNSDCENIEVWELNKNGKMNLIQKINTYGNVQPISIIKKHNLLYAGLRPNNRIDVYSINNNGLLNNTNTSFIPGPPNYISFDQDENFLFCSSYHKNCISVSPLNKYGIPQQPIQIIHNIKGCHAAKMNHKYNILFVTSLKEDCIYFYYLTEFGILKSTNQTPIYTQKKSGPRHLVFHPNYKFMYTINELNGTIDVWSITNEGNLIKIENIQNINILDCQISQSYWSADIHITSCGRFLYVSDRILNTISLFHVNKDNKKLIFYTSYVTAEQPRSFCIDTDNCLLIVIGQKSNKIVIYSISENTGELTKLNSYKTNIGALWVLIHNIV
ncbi:MAG: 6-phosphogluconolactonase [Buchnera aphidicola (Pentalonia nigronervosa)]|jgi:6-phosphogluconolactonase|uniref:6-phosphogluconolactonase n=1 Tax=Buchnera aphidicola (Pentalonia nigronervosa) TaxID=1309793 RepID=A0A7H1AZS8_9GAMM|nr:MAG: 6-phosphogluconolactonase [Buchnera aphidicola (Pentalonia nigronervosa)]